MSSSFANTHANAHQSQKQSEFETKTIVDKWAFYKEREMQRRRKDQIYACQEDKPDKREHEIKKHELRRLDMMANMFKAKKMQLMNIIETESEEIKGMLMEQVEAIDKQMEQIGAHTKKFQDQQSKVELKKRKAELMEKLADVQAEEEIWEQYKHSMAKEIGKEQWNNVEKQLRNVGEEIRQRKEAIQDGLKQLEKLQKQVDH